MLDPAGRGRALHSPLGGRFLRDRRCLPRKKVRRVHVRVHARYGSAIVGSVSPHGVSW